MLDDEDDGASDDGIPSESDEDQEVLSGGGRFLHGARANRCSGSGSEDVEFALEHGTSSTRNLRKANQPRDDDFHPDSGEEGNAAAGDEPWQGGSDGDDGGSEDGDVVMIEDEGQELKGAELEKIMATKQENGQLQYLCKFKGAALTSQSLQYFACFLHCIACCVIVCVCEAPAILVARHSTRAA